MATSSYLISLGIEASVGYMLGPRFGYNPTSSAVITLVVAEGVQKFMGVYPLQSWIQNLLQGNSTTNMVKL